MYVHVYLHTYVAILHVYLCISYSCILVLILGLEIVLKLHECPDITMFSIAIIRGCMYMATLNFPSLVFTSVKTVLFVQTYIASLLVTYLEAFLDILYIDEIANV